MDKKADIVSALYDATGRGDWEAAEAHLTDDFFITEADTLPYAGIYRGKSALRDLYTKVMTMMDVAGLELIQTTTGGDYAITLVKFAFNSPDLAQAELAEMYRFRGDLICEIKPYYFDPAPIVAAVAAKRGG